MFTSCTVCAVGVRVTRLLTEQASMNVKSKLDVSVNGLLSEVDVAVTVTVCF